MPLDFALRERWGKCFADFKLTLDATYLRPLLHAHQHRIYCLRSDSRLRREWMVPATDSHCDHSDRRCCLDQDHQILIDLTPGCDHLMNLILSLILKRIFQD